RHAERPAAWLGAMLVLTAASASTAGWFTASRLPLIVAAQVADPSASFGSVVARQAFGIVVLLLPMTMALGAAFPLALAAGSSQRSALGGVAARVYTSNTVGAIAGALASGFAIVPAWGLEVTMRGVAAMAIACGACCMAAALLRFDPARLRVV